MQEGPASEGGRHASHRSFFSYTYSDVLELYTLPGSGKACQIMGFVPAVTSSSGPRAEFLEAVAYYKQRYACLAESVPARNVRLAAGSSLLAKSLPTSPSRIMKSRTL